MKTYILFASLFLLNTIIPSVNCDVPTDLSTLDSTPQSESSVSSPSPSSPLNWAMAGLNSLANRYQPQSRINRVNAPQLSLAWTFKTDPHVTDSSGVSATPTVVDGYIYFPTWSGKIYCIRELDGVLVWRKSFSSRTSATVAGSLIIYGQYSGGAKVAAFDRATGAHVWTTTIDGYEHATITQSGLYRNGVFYVGTSSLEELVTGADPNFVCCNFIGQFAAINALTGSVLWKTKTISVDGFYGGPIWGSSPSYLESKDYVYFTTGNNYKVPQDVADCIKNLPDRSSNGSQCNVPGNLVDSIVAVKSSDGSIVWSKQFQGVDYYTDACWYNSSLCQIPMGPDFDFAQGPVLWQRGSRWILGAGSKSGVFFALDAINGQDVWRTAVGPGGGYGGLGWGSSVNDEYIFVSLINDGLQPFTVLDKTYCSGGWFALDKNSGNIKWFRSARPVLTTYDCGTLLEDDWPIAQFPAAFGAISSTDQVMIAASFFEGHIMVLDERNGNVLWEFQANATVHAGVAITRDSFYIGSGYVSPILPAEPSNKFYAFRLP